mgnify:CR=1 FL=1|tara:strand:- start:418 stop:528 length:111 start_codon:yes stop_codon:yes gene_type:complete
MSDFKCNEEYRSVAPPDSQGGGLVKLALGNESGGAE